MKQLPTILSVLALAGVIVLFTMNMSDGKEGGGGITSNSDGSVNAAGQVAYVNIDTLQAHYTYFQVKKEELEERQQTMSDELKRSQKKFESDYRSTQRKAQAGTLTQVEYETAAKRLSQMQQSLESRDAALTQQLLKEQDDFNRDLKQRLDEYLVDYNKDKGFDYILSYSKALGSILLVNPNLDITQDVIKGMNAAYEIEAEKGQKEVKKENK